MRIFLVTCLLLVTTLSNAAPPAYVPPLMRPYAGIGIVMLGIDAREDAEQPEPLYLYEEPAMFRVGELHLRNIPPYEWLFGGNPGALPLIVMARKGEWLRVVYDDAGRDAWLNPQRRGVFQSWDGFFKGQSARLLSGLPKKSYQLFQQPGKKPAATMTPKQAFKVLKLDSDWAMVMLNQSSLGWLRWRDEDGRLLIALERAVTNQKP